MLIKIISLLFLLSVIIMTFKVRRDEYKQYNNGICLKCGNEIESFDMDSQGGTGWVCRLCNRYFWTSWVK
jgi:DNA-directed RNA polymerase subunit RPC12/RpoP